MYHRTFGYGRNSGYSNLKQNRPKIALCHLTPINFTRFIRENKNNWRNSWKYSAQPYLINYQAFLYVHILCELDSIAIHKSLAQQRKCRNVVKSLNKQINPEEIWTHIFFKYIKILDKVNRTLFRDECDILNEIAVLCLYHINYDSMILF